MVAAPPSTAERSAEPPAGPPWDTPLAEAPLAFVDCEMTGLDPTEDRIVELCIERTRGGVVEGSLTTLVRPDARLGGNAHIHGLDAEALASAPPFADVADRVFELLAGAVPVAHAAQHDAAFLEAELARAGRPAPEPHWIDTLTLSRRAFAQPSHALDRLAPALGLPRSRAHRAADDVETLRALFDLIVPRLAPHTPRDLWHVRIGERHARPEILAACAEAARSGKPVEIVLRPAHGAARMVLAVVTAVRADLDPPRVVGYALPGRGRFEQRADRILSVGAAGTASAASAPRTP